MQPRNDIKPTRRTRHGVTGHTRTPRRAFRRAVGHPAWRVRMIAGRRLASTHGRQRRSDIRTADRETAAAEGARMDRRWKKAQRKARRT